MRSLILDILLSSAAIAASILLLSDIADDIHVITKSSASDVITNSSDHDSVLRYLISTSHLAAGDRAICLGPDSAAIAGSMRHLGFPSASAAISSCDLAKFEPDSFDFAIGVSFDRVRVPARAALDMERVLKPGGVGVVLRVGSDLMRAAAPLVALLRFSEVVGATAVNGSVMVIFKKLGPVGGNNNIGSECCDGMTKLSLVFDGINEVLRAVSLAGGVYAGHLV